MSCSEYDEDSTEAGWIQWFCSLEGHDFYVEVDEDYIRDNFNLYGLRPLLSNYDKALDTILAREPCDDDMCSRDFIEHYRDVTNLYGLIHARYILSPRGLVQMKDKLVCGTFGKCPRVFCEDQYTLPVGLSDELRAHRIRVYCPCCQEVYDPHDARQDRDSPSSSGGSASAGSLLATNGVGGNGSGYAEIDGAFFGSSFPHIFLQTYPSLVPLEKPLYYEPKVFGFRVHSRKSVVQLKLEQGEYGESLVPDNLRPRRGRSAQRSRATDNGCDGGDEATCDDGDLKEERAGVPGVNRDGNECASSRPRGSPPTVGGDGCDGENSTLSKRGGKSGDDYVIREDAYIKQVSNR